MNLYLTPELVTVLVTVLVTAVGVVYLARLKHKSTDTKLILAFLALTLVASGNHLAFSLTHVQQLFGAEGVRLAPLAVFVSMSLYLASWFVGLLVAYRVGFRLHIWEERIVLFTFGMMYVATIATAFLNVSGYVQMVDTLVVVILIYGFSIIGVSVAVLVRKAWAAFRRRYPPQTRGMILLILGGLLVWVFGFAGGMAIPFFGIPAEIQGSIRLLATLLINALFFLAVLLYGAERHSVQAKLVGFLLVVYAMVITFSVTSIYPALRTVEDFYGTTEAQTLLFSPTPPGGYTATREPAAWINPIASLEKLSDDGARASALPFSFPFYGARYDTVYVGANGVLSFREPLDVETRYGEGGSINRRVPVITPMYADLRVSDVRGGIRVDTSEERVVITWQRMSDYGIQGLLVDTQVELSADGRIRMHYPRQTARPLLRFTGISPGGPQDHTDLSSLPRTVDTQGALLERRDDRLAYRQHVHADTVTLGWVALVGIFLVGGIGVFFYRVGLVLPLGKVLAGLKQVEGGDLDAQVHIEERNELGALANHFNSMAQSLQAYSEQMEDLVAVRTKALHATVEDLKQTQAQLVQQEKMASLGQLTAGIAHEIKNPLNFVNNFAEVNEELADELREAWQNNEAEVEELLDDLKQNAQVIAQHGKRADAIVHAMMQHASGGTGQREAIEINALVSEHIDLAYHGKKAQVPDLQVEIKRNLDANADTIEVIPQEIGRVLLNLLGNAFDAVHEHTAAINRPYTPTVTVSTQRVGEAVEIRVSDNGPGIPAEIRKKVFEPFFTTKPAGSGTGLGLSMSYDIVTQGHGGTLTIQDTSNGGAAFVVTLPRRKA